MVSEPGMIMVALLVRLVIMRRRLSLPGTAYAFTEKLATSHEEAGAEVCMIEHLWLMLALRFKA